MRAVLFASSIALALASGSALAADLSLKGPPPAAALSWTGCYIDGGVGYGMWNQDHYAETSGLVAGSVATTDGGRGWLGRVGAGCDYQVSPSIVVGAFGDYDWMGLNGTSSLDVAGVTTSTTLSGIAGNESETGAWSVGARIGYLVTPRLLSYFDGGYTQTTFGQVNYNNAATGAATGLSLPATTYKGWFIGGGTEYAFTWLPINGLFWRTEYRYAQYQNADVSSFVTATGAPTGFGQRESPQVQTVTTSLVWRFNWGNW